MSKNTKVSLKKRTVDLVELARRWRILLKILLPELMAERAGVRREFPDPAAVTAADVCVDALGVGPRFVNGGELISFTGEVVREYSSDTLEDGWEEFLPEIVETLVTRATVGSDNAYLFAMCVSRSGTSNYGASAVAPTSSALWLASLPSGRRSFEYSVGGRVRAASFASAALTAQTVVVEAIGAKLVLGLGEVRSGPSASRSETGIEVFRCEPATSLWRGPSERLPLSAEAAELVSRLAIVTPALPGRDEPDHRRASTTAHPGQSEQSGQPELRLLTALFSSTSMEALTIRASSRRFAEALVAHDYGRSCAASCAALEGILLDGKSTESCLARLSEAIAHRLGTGAAERRELRRLTAAIYDVRSRHDHAGHVAIKETPGMRQQWLRIVQAVIRREIADMDN
ncbi:MAG: hypothetical protein Q8O67_11000 [Deltaproteobacteria bacterium]|nr:hypothetical protein [Deltaproteobacteria bacterium]